MTEASSTPVAGVARADVDDVFRAVAEKRGIALGKLDRRKLEATLAELPLSPMDRERAVMVFVARARQRRIEAVRRNARRLRRTGVLLVALVALGVYTTRLTNKLEAKLRRAEHARAIYVRAAESVEVADARRAAVSLTDPSRPTLDAALDEAEAALSRARRAYDDDASEYTGAVRGFPTAPLARWVGLPAKAPSSFDVDAGRARAAPTAPPRAAAEESPR